MAVKGSTELLSPEDKRLAVSNAIGLATAWGLNAALSSDAPKNFKTLSEIAGFVATAANHLWRQSLTARLPLAQQNWCLQKAVAPLPYLGMNVAAGFCSLDRTGDLALPGFGISLVTPAASAVVVGHNALQKIGRCFSSLTTRPWEALTAIPIHLLNLASSADWAISSWSGMDAWRAQDQFFMEHGAPISSISHALWNPGLRIQADAALRAEKSAEALKALQDRLTQMKTQLQEAVDRLDFPRDLLAVSNPIRNEFWRLSFLDTIDNPMQPGDKKTAQSAIAAAEIKLKEIWDNAWSRWEGQHKDAFQSQLNELLRKAMPTIESETLWRKCSQPLAQLNRLCQEQEQLLPKSHDYPFLVGAKHGFQSISQVRDAIIFPCLDAVFALRKPCTDSLGTTFLKFDQDLKDCTASVERAVNQSKSFDEFRSAYLLADAKFQDICSKAKTLFQESLQEDPVDLEKYADAQEWRSLLTSAQKNFEEICQKASSEMQRHYVSRTQQDGDWRAKIWAHLFADSDQPDSPPKQEPIPSAEPAPQDNELAPIRQKPGEAERLADYFKRFDPKTCEGAKKILSAIQPFEDQLYQKNKSGYVRKLGRKLALKLHPDKNKELGTAPIIALNAAVATLCHQKSKSVDLDCLSEDSSDLSREARPFRDFEDMFSVFDDLINLGHERKRA
jgi:hypothetical protein